jgi:hypothetical protein
VTPCEVPLTGARGDFEITMLREGYLPQTVPVQVVRAEASAGGPQFTPNPVFAKLEPTVQPKKKKARKKVADKPKPVAEAKVEPAAAVQATPWLPPRW